MALFCASWPLSAAPRPPDSQTRPAGQEISPAVGDKMLRPEHGVTVTKEYWITLPDEEPSDWSDALQAGIEAREDGRVTEAELSLQRSLLLAQTSRRNRERRMALSLGELGELQRDRKRAAQAESLFALGLALHEKVAGPDALELAPALERFASFYEDESRWADARAFFGRAEQLRSRAGDAIFAATDAVALARTDLNLDNPQDARRNAEVALLRVQKIDPWPAGLCATAHYYHARACEALGDVPCAARSYAVALDLVAPFGWSDRRAVMVATSFEAFLRTRGDTARADSLQNILASGQGDWQRRALGVR